METTGIALPLAGPGTRRRLTVHRFGKPGARPKVYVQGGLHADEGPGMLTAVLLRDRLAAAEAAGGLNGEVVLIPAANPIGLDQALLGQPVGRYDMGSGGNFNRGYPDLTAAAAERLAGQLGPDAAANVATVRSALAAAVAAWTPRHPADALRKTLLGLAVDADIVLDLHCDSIAPMHLYLGTPLWPDAADLAVSLNADLVLLAAVSGGEPFDEAVSSPWWLLPERLGLDAGTPLPPACLATTIELRGAEDVSLAQARADADGLMRFLAGRGIVDGPGPGTEFTGVVAPLAGVDLVRAPTGGLVDLLVTLGDRVVAGQPVATIVDPTAPDPVATAVTLTAATDGPVWSLTRERVATAGTVIAKIAGAAPLAGKGAHLLTD